MRRNSNLELRLLPSSPFDLPSSDSGDNHHHHHPNHHMMVESSSGRAQDKEEQQQELTIFYNGRVCVCHVTELQARSILLLANREMEDHQRMKTGRGSEPSSPALQTSHLYASMDGLSMKRSLQRFLQKRKHRTQATSPYHQ